MKNSFEIVRDRYFLKFVSFIGLAIFFLSPAITVAQTGTNGDYRTRTSGSWSGAGTWQVRTLASWANTATPPSSTSNIYIQNGHTLTVDVATADCNDLQINAGGGVTIGINTLQVSGKLRAYTGTTVTATGADGTFYSNQGSTINPVNAMISSSGAGILKFIGSTRNITNTGEWGSALTNYSTEFALAAGNTGTLQTGYKSSAILISSGIIDMGANRLSPDNGNTDQGNLTIAANAIVMSANSGAASGNSVFSRTTTNKSGTFTLNGKLVLSGISPEIQFTTVNINAGSTIEYSRAGNQDFVKSTFPGAAAIGSSYHNITFSGSGTKTPPGNFSVSNDLAISGTAVLPLSSFTVTVGGSWTNYAAAGLNEQTSTVDFNGSAAQSINTTGGENFYIMKKSGSGTLTLNSNVRVDGGGSSNVNISAGTLDAGTFTFDGSASTVFNMSNGLLKQAKLSTTLPEFSISSYNITGGTIELNGAGTQTLRGGRDYRNLTFSNSGTKAVSTGISNITGTITVANTAVLDVSNSNMGGAGTNLTMTGTSVYKTAGASQTKPDAQGTYSLGAGTTVEFTNTAGGLESIRLGTPAISYYNIIVSGTSVGTTSLGIGVRFQSGGTFTVKNGGVFKLENSNGFSGAVNTSIDNTNTPTIVLEPGSIVEYNGTAQTITNQTINTPANANYEGLTLSGTGTKTAPASTLIIKGNLTKSGTTLFAHNNGMVVLNGSASQAYNATAPVMDFYVLTNNNTVDLTINNDLTVTRQLGFGTNAKLNLEDGNITIRSTSAGTAQVGIIPSTANITYSSNGRFIVERYIPTGVSHAKSWQLLAVPTNGGQTVNAAWQEGAVSANANPVPGYGTQITSNISPLPSLFDVFTSPGPSMKTFNPVSNGWDGIANTTTLPIYNQQGYMVFVRGDRSVITSGGTANQTILRTTGKIFDPVSNIPPVTDIPLNSFESAGNPYASAIDFSDDAAVIKSANVQKVFYVWDPKLGGAFGFGAYQTFTKGIGPDPDYYVSPGGGSYGAGGSVNNIIESGQAFFVHTVGGTGSVEFTEDAKTSGSAIVFRPGNGQTVSPPKQLRTNLYTISNGSRVLVDGVLSQFSNAFSNGIDKLDALKMGNFAENIGISRNKTILAVERRAIIAKRDTIFYKTAQLKAQQYQFEFIPADIARPGLHAFLEDDFLGTKTPVSVADTTKIVFTVVNVPGSYASDRFRLVFRKRQQPGNYIDEPTEQPINNISVYPNPVTDKTIRLFFNDQPAGKYFVQLINQSGQTVLEQAVMVIGKNFATSVQVPNVAAGNYQLIITSATGDKNTLQVIIK